MAAPETHDMTAYGIPVTVRPLCAADHDRLAAAFRRMSDRSRHLRFLGPKPRLSRAELTYLADVDQRSHAAFAAIDPDDGTIVGVARYAAEPALPGTADVAMFVVDAWQGQGIATLLGRRLVQHADAQGVARLVGSTFAENRPARAVLRRLGFATTSIGGGVVELERSAPRAG